MSLSSDQRRFYQDKGYLLVEKVVSDEQLAELRRVISDVKEQSRRVAVSDARYDVAPGHSAARPMLRRLKNPVTAHPAFDALMRAPAIVDVVAELIGGTVRFDHSKLNFKPAGGQAKIEWHQDWAFYPHTNDDLLAVGVMVEDCTPENGPLMVIPGSHKGPIYDHHHDGYFVGGIKPQALGDLTQQAVSLTAPAGSISLHHVRTLHASQENRSDRERPLLLFSYAAVDAFPVFDSWDLEEFDGRILRGAPTLVPRATAVPMRLSVPRVPGADSIFDDQERVRVA